MTTVNNRFGAIAAFALVLAFTAGAAGAKEAGKVLFVAGTVTAERAPPAALAPGDAVLVGDTIATGDRSRAQILMNDGARVALRANSRYRVDEFGLPASAAATRATATQAEGVTVATLLKGGFRSSTGAIGRDGSGRYEVRTPIGTLGIRGTDYTAIWCQGDCADVAAAAAARNGLYLATHAGAIVFRHGGREVVIEMGQAVFIAAADSLPEPLDALPEWVSGDGAGPLVTGEERGDGEGQGVLPDFSGLSGAPAAQQPAGSSAPDPSDSGGKQGVQRPIRGTVGGQQPVDLTRGTFDQRSPNQPGTPSAPPPANSVPPPNSPPPTSNVPPPPPPTRVPPTGGN